MEKEAKDGAPVMPRALPLLLCRLNTALCASCAGCDARRESEIEMRNSSLRQKPSYVVASSKTIVSSLAPPSCSSSPLRDLLEHMITLIYMALLLR